MNAAELGKRYRHAPSGFEGVATARAEYLHNTPSVQLTCTKGPGEAIVNEWVPEGGLVELPEQEITGFGR